MKAPSAKAGLLWIVVMGVILWWLLSSSEAAAADIVPDDERPFYGPPSPVHGDVDFEEPTVITSDPDVQAGPGGYYTYREDRR